MANYYRVKAFSELTSVTIRTLHYYDEIGLLKPGHKSVGGHRLYTEEDLLKLQQITTLKFMGFPLSEIQKLLQKIDFDIRDSLKIQADALADEAMRIKNAANLIQYLVDQLEIKNNVDWQTVAKIIEVMQMNETAISDWNNKYLPQDEQGDFKKLSGLFTREQWQSYQSRWIILLNAVKQNLHVDPESEIGLKLAEDWLSFIDDIYRDYPELRRKLWKGYQSGTIPTGLFPCDQEIIVYINKAIRKLNQHRVINVTDL